MVRRYLRYIPPIIVSIGGLLIAIWLIRFILLGLVEELGPIALTYDMIRYIDGPVQTDILWLITWIAPIMIVEFIILGLPISAILLIISKMIKSTAHDIDIVQTGKKFSAVKMIKRTVVPALFSISLGGILQGYIAEFLINEPTNLPTEAWGFYQPIFAIITGLIAVPVVLAIYAPTWILNDAGVVFHLKSKELESRRCPDTIGVGRWWSNLLGGFTLVTIPVVTFVQHFYNPYLFHGGLVDIGWVIWGLLFSFGIPFLAIAFMLPVVVFNEIFLGLTRRMIRGVARSLGARELKLETVLTETEIVDEDTEYDWGLKSVPKSGTDAQ
ncbi:MAG: hypothetical protein ACW98Y_10630 [Candidatus Thorarchaeota archaeon]